MDRCNVEVEDGNICFVFCICFIIANRRKQMFDFDSEPTTKCMVSMVIVLISPLLTTSHIHIRTNTSLLRFDKCNFEATQFQDIYFERKSFHHVAFAFFFHFPLPITAIKACDDWNFLLRINAATTKLFPSLFKLNFLKYLKFCCHGELLK